MVRVLTAILGVFAATATSHAAPTRERPAYALTRDCADGFLFSCVELGLRHRYGRSAARDQSLAFDYFKKACDGGLVFACGYAGDMLSDGVGVAKDRAEGERLMRAACEAGDGRSCSSLRRRAMRIELREPALRD